MFCFFKHHPFVCLIFHFFKNFTGMRKWRHGPRLEVLVLLQVVALCCQGNCPAGELCSSCLFCPLGAASLSEGLGVLSELLGLHVSNGHYGKNFHGNRKQPVPAPFSSLTQILFIYLPSQIPLIYFLTFCLPLKGFLLKLPNLHNSLMYMQLITLNYHLPTY